MKAVRRGKGRISKRTTNNPLKRQDKIISRLNRMQEIVIVPQSGEEDGKEDSSIISRIVSSFSDNSKH